MSDQETVIEEEAVAVETEEPTATEEVPPAEVEVAEVPAAEAEPTNENDTGSDIHRLEPRQHLTGKVKNITPFGAFVDVGLAQDGLVHISELARQKVEKVEDVVSVGQEVEVWVKKVDTKRGRISLTMIRPIKLRLRDIEENAELEGTVTRLEAYGAFINIDSERDGLVHISQITHDYIKHPEDALTVGDTVQVKVLKVNRKKRQVDLSIKALLPPPVVEKPAKPQRVKEEVIEIEEEPIPTAMAIAFASVQEQEEQEDAASNKDAASPPKKDKRKKEQDDIVSRTLAAG